MANFTTENNTYCFRIGPAFLDTRLIDFRKYSNAIQFNRRNVCLFLSKNEANRITLRRRFRKR